MILSIYLFVMLFVFVRKYDFVVFILLLQTSLYMLRQSEEYIFPGGGFLHIPTKRFNPEWGWRHYCHSLVSAGAHWLHL